MRTLGLTLVAILSLNGMAMADEGSAAAPAAEPAKAAEAAPMVAKESAPTKFAVDAAIFAGLAQGDYKNTDTSPGVRLAFGYALTPMFSVHAALRYIKVSLSGGGDVSAAYYDIGLGARAGMAVNDKINAYGELELLRGTNSASAGGIDITSDGFGAALHAGGNYALSSAMEAGLGVGYSRAMMSTKVGDMSVDSNSDWLTIEGRFAYKF